MNSPQWLKAVKMSYAANKIIFRLPLFIILGDF